MQKLDDKTNSIVSRLLENNEVGDRRLKVRRQFKNTFFRELIFKKFNNKCNICDTNGTKPYITKKGKSKNNPLVIHHKKYDWKCPYENAVKINCRKCFAEHKEIFVECLNNCVLLCDICHYKLHNKLKRDTGSWV